MVKTISLMCRICSSYLLLFNLYNYEKCQMRRAIVMILNVLFSFLVTWKCSRPFPSSLVPLSQIGSKCEIFL